MVKKFHPEYLKFSIYRKEMTAGVRHPERSESLSRSIAGDLLLSKDRDPPNPDIPIFIGTGRGRLSLHSV
ncbi:hypothetical protein CLW00_102387 [Mongoliibacter ruber]|uniref:Uncharacterized protein n=1 Tax=Mongoliibacter ruber TaxID=1750599 RepID=A0A2T0WT88_9BACT|nr:hypothetical protein CLW00_102387 [Mongoliibacter ruber]